MGAVEARRQERVDGLLTQTRQTLDEASLGRTLLTSIQAQVESLAADTELWGAEHFPDPAENELQTRYHIGSEGDQGITLYLNVMRPGKLIKPHDHTTWACVAAVSGTEVNGLYERTDDGSVEGRATIRQCEEVDLEPGNSLALMPDDIHSVEIRGDEIIRHLHFYGQPLETLKGRKMFNVDAGTYHIMDIGVKTKK